MGRTEGGGQAAGSKTFVVCPKVMTPAARAMAGALTALGWKQAEQSVWPSLFIIDHARSNPIDPEHLGFYHGPGTSYVLLLSASHYPLKDQLPGWLRIKTADALVNDLLDLLLWLAGAPAGGHSCPGADQSYCSLLCGFFGEGPARATRASGDDRAAQTCAGSLACRLLREHALWTEGEPKGWNRSQLYYTVMAITAGHQQFAHDHARELSCTLERDGEERTAVRNRAQFHNACEDLRQSLVTPPTTHEPKKRILVIDDKPQRELLDVVTRHLMPGYSLEYIQDVSGLDSYNSLTPAEQAKRLLKKVGLEGEPPAFILVDQLFEGQAGHSEMAGPAIIRGLSRLMRDHLSKDQPLPSLVAISRAGESHVIQEALRAGAADYVHKDRLLALPGVLAKLERIDGAATNNYHHPFRALSRLPNETVGLLQKLKIPRIPFHRFGVGRSALQDSTAGEIAALLEALPKPDLHVHAGSCMSPEFLVYASLVGLLRRPWDQLATFLPTAVHTCHRLFAEAGEEWIARAARFARVYLRTGLSRSPDDPEYTRIRAIMHEQLRIADYLRPEDASKAVDSKGALDLAFFYLKKEAGWWLGEKEVAKTDDVLRIVLLTMATRYGGARLEYRGRDLLGLFRVHPEGDVTAVWQELHTALWKDEQSEWSMAACRHGSWRLPPSKAPPLTLTWPTPPAITGSNAARLDMGPPEFDSDPIGYACATGLSCNNLEEYLQGCEFSGADHLRHPLLIHLYAQQVILQFVRTGVFYAELKASPDGFINVEAGFEFSHACRTMVEAFAQAQESAVQAHAGADSAPFWIAHVLGASFDRDHLNEAFGSKYGMPRKLPCKVSLIFAGKRHKALREMILEAAAAVVMRPSAEKSVSSAKDFVDHELARCRVVGFDLSGPESRHPPEQFESEFARLSRLHIPLTIHAGENAEAKFIEESILKLRAKRIGHGLSLADDKGLMARVREERVCIELCPVGNHQTSRFVAPDLGKVGRQYPLKTYLEQGLYVTINTDNPIISYTNLIKEYFQASYAHSKEGLSIWDALRLVRMGYGCSFLQLPERRAALDLVEQHLVDMFSSNRMVAWLRELVDRQCVRSAS